MAAKPASPASGRWSWLFGGWSPKTKPKKAPTRDAPGVDEDDEEFYTFDAYHEARASPQTLRKRRSQQPVSNPCALVAASARPRALTPVSEVLVRESEHRDRAVGLAIAREHRRLGAGGRLYTVVFKGDTLGFSLVLARLPESPRSRLVVDATTLGGACYDLVRPLDELVAINNEKLIPIEMEAFPTLVYRLQHGPRPTRLTFSMGYGRDAAFREQSRRRSSRLPPGLPVSPGHQPRAEAFDSPEKVPPPPATPPATPPPPPPPPRSFASAGIQTSSAAGAAASTSTAELLVDLREPVTPVDLRAAPAAPRPAPPRVVDDDAAGDCGCMGDMGDMALSPFALEPCSCPQESGAILGDGLCQWDIDRAGDGEVLSAAEEV